MRHIRPAKKEQRLEINYLGIFQWSNVLMNTTVQLWKGMRVQVLSASLSSKGSNVNVANETSRRNWQQTWKRKKWLKLFYVNKTDWLKAKFQTTNTTNPNYEIGVRSKHNHWLFGNRSPPQEPVNRPVNYHTGTKLQNHNKNLCNDCPKFCFKVKLSKVTYLGIFQWSNVLMTTMVQLRKGMWVQTNLGGQVALSDSNFVPCPRNLRREP